MELALALDAARRYWWAIVLFALLGAVPGVMARQEAELLQESRSVLIIAPARDARVQVSVTGENERYVLGQLAVLQSGALADSVAERLADGTTGDDLLGLIDITHLPETDVVEIAVRSADAARSEEIANAYADVYLESLNDRVDSSASPQVDQIQQQLDVLRTQLALVDEAIQTAMAPYLEAATGSPVAPPTIEQVAPSLVSDRQILLSEYLELLTAQTSLRVGSPFVVASEIVERATPARPAQVGKGSLLIVAGLLGGAVVGLFAALVLARLSPRLLSRAHAAQSLGQHVFGPLHRSVDGLPGFTSPLSRQDRATVAELRAWSQGAEGEHGAAVLLVTEGIRGQGSAAVAAALAISWASDGFRTALVDGDLRRHTLTAHLGEAVQPDAPAHGHDSWMGERLVPTAVPGLGLVAAPTGQSAWRREQVDELLNALVEIAEAVVIDAGPMLGGGLAMHAAPEAGGVAMVIGSRTRSGMLSLAVDQLGARNDRLVTVWSDDAPWIDRVRRRLTRGERDAGSGKKAWATASPA